MIVDGHCHLLWEDSEPMAYFEGLARQGARLQSLGTVEPLDADQLLKVTLPFISDTSGDKLVQLMEAAGIDKTMIFPLDFWYWWETSGQPGKYDIIKKNQIFADAAKNHEDKLYAFFGIDPRRKGSVAAFEKAITKWEMKGLKIHSTARFYPDDPVCYPIYQKATELGVTVVFHSGNQAAPMVAKYSHPMFIDTIAADFPDLRIVIAHIGHGWWQQALDFATAKPNIYVDFSGWQAQYRKNPAHVAHVIRTAIDSLGPWRVIFGSDGPLMNVLMPFPEWINAIKSLTSIKENPLSNEELDIIMGKAAQHLFSL